MEKGSHLFDQNYPHQLKLYCAILLLTSGSVDGNENVINSTRTKTTTDKDDEQRNVPTIWVEIVEWYPLKIKILSAILREE